MSVSQEFSTSSMSLRPAECSVNTLSPVLLMHCDPRRGVPDGSQDIASGWTMKNARRTEKCELCVKQTKAPGNMEFVSTKARCELLLLVGGRLRPLGNSSREGLSAGTKGVTCFDCNCFQVLKFPLLPAAPPAAGTLLITELVRAMRMGITDICNVLTESRDKGKSPKGGAPG